MIQFAPRGTADYTPLGSLGGRLSALLRLRGVRTEEEARAFLHPGLDSLHDPLLLSGMEAAVRRIREAASARERVMVYGDYDADGVCATAILLETLTDAGVKAVSFMLPSRQEDGYGLNEAAVRKMAEKDVRLLITVDCGISNRAEVALARSLGISVIVTDHHQLPEILPEADAIVHPLLGAYPCPHLCGAGVALKICHALLGPEGMAKRLDLAAIATVADVVPLTGENRAIVREGLRHIGTTGRPGLQALLRLAGVTAPLRADALAFRIAPRLNAAGRLGDASLAVHLLLTGVPAKAEAAAAKLEEMNRARQALEQGILSAALRQTAPAAGEAETRLLLAAGEGWNPGLIGLAAGKLCEKYFRPSVVLSLPEGDGPAVGSCRSIPGVNIFEMLRACGDLLLRFGGHEGAAGLTVARENLPALRERLERAIRDSCEESCFVRRLEYDLEVPFGDWTPDTLAELELLEPTGCGCPPPAFLLSGACVDSFRAVGSGGAHLQLSLRTADGISLRGIGFGLGGEAETLPREIDLLYRPVLNEYGGRRSVEAQFSALRRA